jgi:diguanylate cyclase (GGDEF)-like protein/PAS domain S-box-containing protein
MTRAAPAQGTYMNEEPPSQQGLPELRARARWEALLLSLGALGVVATAILGLWVSAESSVHANFDDRLAGLARAAAQLVDPQLQQSIREPAQLNGPDYARAVQPLRRFNAALPDVRYVYTVVRDGSQVRFVLDAAQPGAVNANGRPEQSGVGEVYEGRDPAMVAALGLDDQAPRPDVTDEPYADAWGSFMTGWTPLYDEQHRAIGALGVDVDASVYLARRHAMRNWALVGLAPACLLTILLGLVFYRLRLRAHSSAIETLQAAEIAEWSARRLGEERQRLAALLEATNVGTWTIELSAQTVDYDEGCARLLGDPPEAVAGLPCAQWLERVHEQDREALATALAGLPASSSGLLLNEFRMRRADGEWLWLLTRGRVLERDGEGRNLRVGGIQVDISDRKEAELNTRDSEARLRALFDLSPVGIALNDFTSGRFLQVNDALLAPTGHSREELLQMTYWDITPAEFAPGEQAQIEAMRSTGRYGPYEKEYLRKDGTRFPVLLSGVRLVDKNGQEIIWSIVQDISRRKAMENELEHAAHRDKLTGLANRARFMERLQRSVERVRAGRQPHIALLYLDFDRFKVVNDTLGHGAGDELLRQIAIRLTQALRSGDARGGDEDGNVVGRFGGDEFLVLVNDLRDPRDATRIAERLLNALSPAYSLSGTEVFSSASIGIAGSSTGAESPDDLVRNADLAMYEAKRAGRACSVEFSEVMHTRLMRHVSIETSLRRAIGTSELSLVYQPIVALDSGRMVSAEALLRWQHPQMGAISPSEFIPIAEDSGLVVALGQWVLNQSCAQLARWRREDPARAPEYVSVNLSRAELALGQRLHAQVQRTLAAHELPGGCLQLEVTEREVMRNPTEALALMKSLQALGVRIAMDDFGTGTSSLAFLRDYPFNTIKIDRTFVKDLEASNDVLAVIHATITLVENLGMVSVAEGVENTGQLAVLQSLGCRYGQGYLFSRPVPPAQLLQALEYGHSTAPQAGALQVLNAG